MSKNCVEIISLVSIFCQKPEATHQELPRREQIPMYRKVSYQKMDRYQFKIYQRVKSMFSLQYLTQL